MIYTKNSFKGVKGEEYISLWAKQNGYTYVKCKQKTNEWLKGVDCFINDVPCDVKNTAYIFFGRYNLDMKKFFVRHPFRPSTIAKNYIWLKDSLNSTEVVYYGPISDYLINNYFKDESSFNDFKKVINTYDNHSYDEYPTLSSVDDFNDKLCSFLQKYLKDDVLINYPKMKHLYRFENLNNSNELCLKLIKRDAFNERYKNKRKERNITV